MKISVSFPGQRATGRELYHRVQLEPNGSPLRFDFRYRIVDDDGRRELVLMESGLVQPFDDPNDADPDNLAAVSAAAIADFKENWTRYERAARTTLASAIGDPALTARPRERRVLSDEFLADVLTRHRAAERRGLQGTATVAREELVGTSTVRNWLRKARERGIEGAS